MSNIKYQLTNDQVSDLIVDALKIYPTNLSMLTQEITVKPIDFIFKNYINYHNLNIEEHVMIRYMGLYNGNTLYDFYNITKSQ